MTMMNKSGESGQPCYRPLPLWKKEDGSSFTKHNKFFTCDTAHNPI
jgi:hypothetical protein